MSKPDWNTLFVFFAIAIIAVGFGFAVDQGYEDSLNETSVTNETLTISEFNTPLNLSNSNIDGGRYDNTTTVYNATSVELSRGSDYRWNDHNGTINFSDTASTSAGMDVTVSYTYREPDTVQLGMLRLWESFHSALGAIVLVAGIAVVLWVMHSKGMKLP